jgi:hypothetical protein
MNITRVTNSDPLVTHIFDIDYENKNYSATVWTNTGSNKFVDWEIVNMDGDPVLHEISEKIIAEIDKQWEKL